MVSVISPLEVFCLFCFVFEFTNSQSVVHNLEIFTFSSAVSFTSRFPEDNDPICPSCALSVKSVSWISDDGRLWFCRNPLILCLPQQESIAIEMIAEIPHSTSLTSQQGLVRGEAKLQGGAE